MAVMRQYFYANLGNIIKPQFKPLLVLVVGQIFRCRSGPGLASQLGKIWTGSLGKFGLGHRFKLEEIKMRSKLDEVQFSMKIGSKCR